MRTCAVIAFTGLVALAAFNTPGTAEESDASEQATGGVYTPPKMPRPPIYRRPDSRTNTTPTPTVTSPTQNGYPYPTQQPTRSNAPLEGAFGNYPAPAENAPGMLPHNLGLPPSSMIPPGQSPEAVTQPIQPQPGNSGPVGEYSPPATQPIRPTGAAPIQGQPSYPPTQGGGSPAPSISVSRTSETAASSSAAHPHYPSGSAYPVRQAAVPDNRAGVGSRVLLTGGEGSPTAPGPAMNASPGTPQAPFTLSPQEQTHVIQILDLWERKSDRINTYECAFERWEYDPVFGPGAEIPKTKSFGQVSYVKPDKGSYKVTEVLKYDPAANDWKEHESVHPEHWVCDGEAVHEFNYARKQLIVRPLPPELHGKAITEGPLPFLFGAKSQNLQRRYFIRLDPLQPQENQEEVWLEAWPRFQQDRANFQRVRIILDKDRFLPRAMEVHLPNGKNRTVYMFKDADVNNPNPLKRIFGVFKKPSTPFGWKKIVEEIPPPGASQQASPGTAPPTSSAATAAPSPTTTNPRQATRPQPVGSGRRLMPGR